jgi:hypothetical protein
MVMKVDIDDGNTMEPNNIKVALKINTEKFFYVLVIDTIRGAF